MTFRVLSAEILHETNTFSMHRTDLKAFENCYLFWGSQALAERGDKNTELAGLLDVARLHSWQLDHILSASAGPGGLVTTDAFETLFGPVVSAAETCEYQGIFLMLHGAMVTDFCNDGEGEILRRLRAIAGPDIPIAVTLDPHANVSPVMCELANILVSYTTYPHIDMRTTGQRAATLLRRTMAGEITPRTLRAHRPMLEEVNGGRTDIGPMIDRHASARSYENATEDVFAISVNGAFPCADIADMGPTVLVTCQGDTVSHQAIAEELADDIWAHRNDVLNTYYTAIEAAEVAESWQAGSKGPLVIADYADNPGAGAYGDSTALLSALMDAQLTNACFGPLVDPAAAKLLQQETVGSDVSLPIGGNMAPDFGGGPLHVSGTLRWRGEGVVVGSGPMLAGLKRNFGPTAVLRVDGIDILIVSIAHQMLDLQQFQTFGIEPAEKNVIGLKSMQHFRAAFGPISKKIIVCDSGALCTTNYNLLPYKNVKRPIHPLDKF